MKIKVIIVKITVMGGVLLAQGSPHCLEWWAGLGSHERMLCPQGFLPELRENSGGMISTDSFKRWGD